MPPLETWHGCSSTAGSSLTSLAKAPHHSGMRDSGPESLWALGALSDFLVWPACLLVQEVEEGPGNGHRMTFRAPFGGFAFLLCAADFHLTGLYSGQRRGWA